MKTVWDRDGSKTSVTAPLSLIVSAFASVTDVRRSLTPQLTIGGEATRLLLIDLSAGRNRLGASALAQVYGQLGNRAPDVDDAARLRAFFQAIQSLNEDGKLLAYHDRSDGGLFATLCEMAFASGCGLDIDLASQTGADDRDAVLAALFNEELGAVIQVRASEQVAVMEALESFGLASLTHDLGAPRDDNSVTVCSGETALLSSTRETLRAA